MARTKELTVEDKLKYLYELQQVDSKIDSLRILAGELPQEVKDMADEVEGLKTRLANIENDIKECEMQISDHRVRTENANASISRYREQQNSVRNNREFDNLNKEIEYQEEKLIHIVFITSGKPKRWFIGQQFPQLLSQWLLDSSSQTLQCMPSHYFLV